jgi:Sulfotransferase domain
MSQSEPDIAARATLALKGFLARNRDLGWRVDIVSYPRSGSTLLRQYLSILQGRPQPSAYAGDVVAVAGQKLTDVLDHVVFRKSHQFPVGSTDTIYLVRDGRNASLSFLYMSFLFGGHSFSQRSDLRAALSWLDRAEGSWASHVAEALAQSQRRRMLFLRSEDLFGDPQTVLVRLAAFAGAELSPEIADRCIATSRGLDTYAENPFNGYRHVPEPGTIYELLQRHRHEDYWRHIFTPPARRYIHATGATGPLRHFGYETSANWWRR